MRIGNDLSTIGLDVGNFRILGAITMISLHYCIYYKDLGGESTVIPAPLLIVDSAEPILLLHLAITTDYVGMLFGKPYQRTVAFTGELRLKVGHNEWRDGPLVNGLPFCNVVSHTGVAIISHRGRQYTKMLATKGWPARPIDPRVTFEFSDSEQQH